MSTANHTSVIRGPGTSTAFTSEPTTRLTANTVYQLTTDARRLLDPAVPVVVEVDADGPGAGGYVVAAASTYRVDYLFGIITFTADQGANALVRVSGSYLPVIDLVGITDWSYTAAREVLDDTTINNSTGVRSKKLGLRDVSGSLTLNELLSYDHDPGAGALVLQTLLDTGTPLLIEVAVGGKRFRAWVLLESAEGGGAVADLINSTVNFTGAGRASGLAGYAWEA
jgi:hypothetical protein